MPWAVNTQRGTTLSFGGLPSLPGGIAVRITEEQLNLAKNLVGVTVFDKVLDVPVFVPTTDTRKGLEYKDFLKRHGDMKIAAHKWKEYKKNQGKE